MASLTYSPSAGGWVPTGSTGPTVAPTANDDLIVPSGVQVEVASNLTFATLTLEEGSGTAKVIVDEGVTLTGRITTEPGTRLQLGNNTSAPNPNNPAVLNGPVFMQSDVSPGDFGFFTMFAQRLSTMAIYSGVLNGNVQNTGDSYIRVNGFVSFDASNSIDIGPVEYKEGSPETVFSAAPGAVVTLTGTPTADQLLRVTGALGKQGITTKFTGDWTGAPSIDLRAIPSVQLSGATLKNDTVTSSNAAQVSSTTFDTDILFDTLNWSPGSYNAFSNGLTGNHDPTILNVPGASVGFGSGLVSNVTVNLSENALLYGYFGVGIVDLTFDAGSAINILGAAQLDFDSRFANNFVLEGSLDLLTTTSAYTATISNSAGTTQFAAGASVTVGLKTTLDIATTLDNESTIRLTGGTVEIDQTATNLGTIQFAAPSSTLQIGNKFSTPFAVTATLLDFSNTDTVLFAGITFGSNAHFSLSGSTLEVFDQNGTLDGTFTLQRSDIQNYTTSSFALGSSTLGMTLTTTGITAEVMPGITANATATYSTGGPPAVLDAALKLSDTASATIAGATVSIVDFNPGDLLNFTNQNGIIGAYDATTGVLTLGGTASIASYQAALESVSYSVTPANGDPTGGGNLPHRTITWTVNDGIAASAVATSTLTTARVGPAITVGGTVSYSPGQSPVVLDSALSLTDPSSATLTGAIVAVTTGSFPGDGDMLTADPTGTAITASYDPISEVLTLSGTDTVADYQAVLRSVEFADISTDPTNGGASTTRTITWVANDGFATSALITSTASLASPRTMLWTGAGGSTFADATNWNDTTDATNPAASPPGVGDVAQFANGGGTVAGTGTAAALDFAGSVVWTVSAGASLSAGIGASIGGDSDLLIEGTVLAGTTATTDPQFGFDIAPSSAGAGTVDVVGANALLSSTGPFIVGDLGVGALTISAGGTVISTPGPAAAISAVIGNAAGADGANVSVNGKGSAWHVGGALLVGNEAGGTLAITAAGTISASTLDTGAGASGIVSVTGAGSALTLSGSLIVGDAASAKMSILSGGMVSAVDADIGLGASATGSVDIEGAGSHFDISDNLNIGDAGVGVLTLGNSTELTVVNTLNIGADGVLNQFGGVIDPSVVNNTGRAGGSGAISAAVSIVNSGTIFASGGTETVTSPIITSTSVLEIDTNGDLTLNVGSVVGTETVTFTDGTGVLTIGTLGGFAATIGDFISGDSIVVQGISITSTSFDASTHVLTLFDPSSTVAGTLQFGSSVTNGSTIVVNGVTPCFVAGTRISTERGEMRVEELRVGDRVQVLSLERHPQLQPIIWLGQRTVDCARHPEPHKVWPVRVAAHAFGPNRPERDVYLSPDHALYIDNVLIPVKHLINGNSIAQVQRDIVTYHHVELPRHAVLLAEGLPAESYLDTGDRTSFANSSAPIALYPDFASRVWEAKGCAPVVVTGPAVEAARRRIDSLAGSTAWAA